MYFLCHRIFQSLVDPVMEILGIQLKTELPIYRGALDIFFFFFHTVFFFTFYFAFGLLMVKEADAMPELLLELNLASMEHDTIVVEWRCRRAVVDSLASVKILLLVS